MRRRKKQRTGGMRKTGPPKALKRNFHIGTVLKRRDLLTEALRFEFEGKSVSGPSFERLVSVVGAALGAGIEHDILLRSCLHLIDMPLSREALQEFAHRLAGNMHRLTDNTAVTPWVVQMVAEWVPVQVMAVRRQQGPSGKFGAYLTLKVLAGSPCPLIIYQWWSWGRCKFRARELGFSRPPGPQALYPAKRPFTHVEQLVTLRFYAYIEPELCELGAPGFYHVQATPAVKAWNTEQLRYRYRDEGHECPEGHPRSFPCHVCPRGYSTCRAGTHARDYVFKECPQCKEKEAPFDPDWPSALPCVNCYNASQSKRLNLL